MERKEVIVSEQELARQKEFTRKMRERNDRRTRTPLALVDTFGCQQNVADGEVLMGMLREMGYELTRDENQADVILLNTCAIREHAEKRVYGHLGRLSHTKAAKPDQIICLCGCMAQQKVVADKVKNSYHHVDLVLGPQAEWRLPELLHEVYTKNKRVFSIENEHGRIAEDLPIVREGGVRAWVSIMYGCNNFCSYCIVPYVRGRERSRAPEKIVEEVRQLAAEGFGEVEAVVGQCLGTPEEKLFRGRVQELAAGRFDSLSVLLVEAAEVQPRRTPGLPDEAFERGSVPMTKQEVRAAVLAKLAVRPEDILWDVGAGTGSVSVELALAAPRGRVYAVECDPEGCALIRANRQRFLARNLTLVEGLAPAALADLPAPDAVFIGGSKGSLAAIVDAALEKNPAARICASAIALETLSAAVAALTARGRTVQVSQIAVSRARAVGGLHLMMAQNPIYLITGE